MLRAVAHPPSSEHGRCESRQETETNPGSGEGSGMWTSEERPRGHEGGLAKLIGGRDWHSCRGGGRWVLRRRTREAGRQSVQEIIYAGGGEGGGRQVGRASAPPGSFLTHPPLRLVPQGRLTRTPTPMKYAKHSIMWDARSLDICESKPPPPNPTPGLLSLCCFFLLSCSTHAPHPACTFRPS